MLLQLTFILASGHHIFCFSWVVRANWVFTVETAPALYRCVLMSYMLPYVQYTLECLYFETLPSFEVSDAMFMLVPWLAIVVGYSKYTNEEETLGKSTKEQ
jgi:hypothetical protein